jgi:hypothetical protein
MMNDVNVRFEDEMQDKLAMVRPYIGKSRGIRIKVGSSVLWCSERILGCM